MGRYGGVFLLQGMTTTTATAARNIATAAAAAAPAVCAMLLVNGVVPVSLCCSAVALSTSQFKKNLAVRIVICDTYNNALPSN